MIELIFAIVIIGITLLSIPNLISTAAKSGYTAMQQESVAVASSHMSLILSMSWDEEDTNITRGGPIFRVTNGTASLDTRKGLLSRDFVGTGGPYNASAALTQESGDYDDIDDAAGTTISLKNEESTDAQTGDIIDVDISLSTTVDYLDDTADTNDYHNASSIDFNFDSVTKTPPQTTNIKMITTTLTTSNTATELEKNIILKAFGCNNGRFSPATAEKL